MRNAAEASPMLDQYRRLKAEHPGCILLFRMGDFYETFGDDALVASRVLGIALTSRDKKRDPIPLAGVPYHAVEAYLRKLVEQGFSVAIAEQMEPADQAKGLVERQVVEVITPGTITRPGLLDARESNFIAALLPGDKRVGVAVAEVSTGSFRIGEIECGALDSLAVEFPAREILLPDGAEMPRTDGVEESPLDRAHFTRAPRTTFDPGAGESALRRRFGVRTLEAFGLDVQSEGYGAAGALLEYLRSLQKSEIPHIRTVRPLREGTPLLVDEATLRNLEIFDSPAGREHTLLALLDRTETAMGARAIRALLRAPASDPERIKARLARTESFAASSTLRADARDRLHRFPDLERIVGLLGSGRATPRDLGTLREALRRFPGLRLTLEGHRTPPVADWLRRLPDLSELTALLESALAEELPPSATAGGIIRAGYDSDLDRLRGDASEVRALLLGLETRERARTGIGNLKVVYHRVFGYLIEVTRSQLGRVPEDYVRRQTLVNAERFVTPELSRMEERVEASTLESQRLEAAHFHRLRDRALEAMDGLASAAEVVAEIDVHLALGDVAARERWIRPVIEEGQDLLLERARHPMVERSLEPGAFVPNDLHLRPDREQIWLITGPNMGGKSTFLRQIGICVYLAQVGSFVPCSTAKVGLVDRIFTRVGAADRIARGASTFFVEMQETATILHQATDRSLVLLDEIGRGTSTYDGLSLAWAVTETLHNGPGARPRTLFATHYHELTDLEQTLPRLTNRTLRVTERDGAIVFLHAIAPGRADRSYGIHVAQLAGVPGSVLRRAEEILHRLELEHEGAVRSGGAKSTPGPRHVDEGQERPGVSRSEREALLAELKALPLESMTPIDALTALARLREAARTATR